MPTITEYTQEQIEAMSDAALVGFENTASIEASALIWGPSEEYEEHFAEVNQRVIWARDEIERRGLLRLPLPFPRHSS